MQDLRSLLTPREVPTERAIKVYLTLLSLLQGPDPRQTGQKTAFTYVSVHTCMTLVFNLLISLLLFSLQKWCLRGNSHCRRILPLCVLDASLTPQRLKTLMPNWCPADPRKKDEAPIIPTTVLPLELPELGRSSFFLAVMNTAEITYVHVMSAWACVVSAR